MINRFRRDVTMLPPDVSRETIEKLVIYEKLLRQWTSVINLVSAETVDHSFERHIADSWQLIAHLPKTGSVIDLGSGAGFPGMVIAIAGGRPVTLVESDRRKCAFLWEVAARTGTEVEILPSRAEQIEGKVADVVTARACAPLDRLLGWAELFFEGSSLCLFPKGKTYLIEMEEASRRWEFACEILPSAIESESVILKVRDFRRL